VVNNFTVTDELVDVHWISNRNITGGGFWDTKNPTQTQTVCNGRGTYSITNNTVDIKISLTDSTGNTKEISAAGRYQFDNPKLFLKLTKGFPRRYIINRETKKQLDVKDYVTEFYRQ
jgi:hypothetical protein